MEQEEEFMPPAGSYQGTIESVGEPITSRLRYGMLFVPIKVCYVTNNEKYSVIVHIGMTLGAWALLRNYTNSFIGKTAHICVKHKRDHRSDGVVMRVEAGFIGETP